MTGEVPRNISREVQPKRVLRQTPNALFRVCLLATTLAFSSKAYATSTSSEIVLPFYTSTPTPTPVEITLPYYTTTPLATRVSTFTSTPTPTRTTERTLTPTAIPSPTPRWCEAHVADIWGHDGKPDGVVNILDFSKLASEFHIRNSIADMDRDGWVTILDFACLVRHFNRVIVRIGLPS